jgi:Ala-tRNA(Pro) deacylase
MNEEAFQRIREILDAVDIRYEVFRHPVCRTSLESAAARAKAGFPEAIGAKALLCKMDFIGQPVEFNSFVLPGPSRIDSIALKSRLQGLKRFRFATPDEMFEQCRISPGYLPPFGKNVFSGVSRLYVDAKLLAYEYLGFNAASLEISIVLRSEDYFRVASPTAILPFATESENVKKEV